MPSHLLKVHCSDCSHEEKWKTFLFKSLTNMPPKKVDSIDDNEKESFRKFLTSLEEDPDLGSDEEKEEEEESDDEDVFLEQQNDDDNDDNDDNDDDDNDSLNEWMREEEEFIEDSEIT